MEPRWRVRTNSLCSVDRDFWSVLTSLPLDLQKKFLLFTTGSDRIPVGGMGEMYFKVRQLKRKGWGGEERERG